TNDSSDVQMTVAPEHFPFVLRDLAFDMALHSSTGGAVRAVVQAKNGGPSGATLSLDGSGDTLSFTDGFAEISAQKANDELLPGWQPETWVLQQSGLTLENTEDVLFRVEYGLS